MLLSNLLINNIAYSIIINEYLYKEETAKIAYIVFLHDNLTNCF